MMDVLLLRCPHCKSGYLKVVPEDNTLKYTVKCVACEMKFSIFKADALIGDLFLKPRDDK